MSSQQHRNALQPDYELFWYRIVKVLGQGNFGITYLAKDINLDRLVAIKEYLPGQLAMRESSLSVHPLSAEHEEDFNFGLERFISEARTLTRFEHPNLIRVFNVFEANNTAYMVMNYEMGESLHQINKKKKDFSEQELMKIILPLMNGLLKMHGTGFIHRDIKPGNIFIRKDGSPVLLDFGSARQTMQVNPQTLTNFVSPGYAPIEQYASKSDKQGPWTDIYGLAATVHKVITGSPPPNSIDRSETITHDGKDCFVPLAMVAKDRYSEKFLHALDHALLFRAQDRPQNIESWRQEFDVTEDDIETTPLPAATGNEPTLKVAPDTAREIERTVKTGTGTVRTGNDGTVKLAEQPADREATKTGPGIFKKPVIYGAIAGTLLLAVVIYFISKPGDETALPDTTAVVDSAPATAPEEPAVLDTESITAGGAEELPQQEQGMDAGGNPEVEQLLASAEENMKKLHLTTPKGDNAYDQFLQVLALDLENEEARNGIIRISDKYIALAYGAMDSGNFDKARNYINKAQDIWPESNKIAAANDALDNRIKTGVQQPATATAEQQSAEVQAEAKADTDQEGESDSVLGGVKKWFKETAEKNKDIKKEETGGDKIIKSIGGAN